MKEFIRILNQSLSVNEKEQNYGEITREFYRLNQKGFDMMLTHSNHRLSFMSLLTTVPKCIAHHLGICKNKLPFFILSPISQKYEIAKIIGSVAIPESIYNDIRNEGAQKEREIAEKKTLLKIETDEPSDLENEIQLAQEIEKIATTAVEIAISTPQNKIHEDPS
jgi:hypothetical protein